MEKFKFLIKNKNFSRLPKTAGVYVFRKDKEILYIGKATNIKERVKQHKELLSLAKQLGYIKTNSEIEALILEANLIKKYRPKYNVVWKDDKNYFYVGITNEDFPRVFITHQPEIVRGSTSFNGYIGPFVDGTALKQTLKILRKAFPYRTCKTLPKHPCLWYQLNRCPAPCRIRTAGLLKSGISKQNVRGSTSNIHSNIQKECQRNAKNLLKVLKGKKDQVLNDLKKEMKMASKYQDFEKAAKTRDQIKYLEKVLAHAQIFEPQLKREINWGKTQKILQKILTIKKTIYRIEAYDISNIQGKEAVGSMVVFTQGKPDKNFYRKFKIKIAGKPNDVAMVKEVLKRRLKHSEWPYPDLILIDGGIAQLNVAKRTKNRKQKTKNIPVMALAKKENKLYIENKKEPLLLKTMPREIFNLILQLRDEAHRFAVSYHRKLRKKILLSN